MQLVSEMKAIARVGADAWHPTVGCSLLAKFSAPPIDTVTLDESRRQVVALIKRSVARHVTAGSLDVDAPVEADPQTLRLVALMAFADSRGKAWHERQQRVAALNGGPWNKYYREPQNRDMLALLHSMYEALQPDVSQEVVPLRGLIIDRYESTFTLETGLKETRRWVRATRDGVAYWEGPHALDYLALDGVTASGGSVRSPSEPGHGGDGHQAIFMLGVDFPTPLTKDQPWDFTITTQTSANPESPRTNSDRHIKPQQSVAKATIRIIFPKDHKPAHIWAFTNVPDWCAPGIPSLSEPVHIDEEGVAEFSWTYPALGRASGIAWQ